MNAEPDWLSEQRKDQEKLFNLAQGSGVGATLSLLLLAPVLAIARTSIGVPGAVVYLLIVCACIVWLAKRFTSRGKVLRYAAITLFVPCCFMVLILALLALSN